MKKAWIGIAFALAALACLEPVTPASAATAAPAWEIQPSAYPTNFKLGSVGRAGSGGPGVYVTAKNVGEEQTSGPFTVSITIPENLEFTQGPESFFEPGEVNGSDSYFRNFECSISGQTAECTGEKSEVSGAWLNMVTGVTVVGPDEPGAEAVATIEGGGAAPASSSAPITISGETPEYDFQGGESGLSFSTRDEAGTPTALAGSHPYTLTIPFRYTLASYNPIISVEQLRSARTELPQGMVVNPGATPKCTEAQFETTSCPRITQVGTVETELDFGAGPAPFTSALYNLTPPPGVPAELGFEPLNGIGPFIHILGGVRSDSDYGISSLTSEILARPVNSILGVNVTLWGNPTAPAHDFLRENGATHGCSNGYNEYKTCPPSERLSTAFLTMPVSCTGDGLDLSLSSNSWENSSRFFARSVTNPEVSGCNQLGFAPTISSKPTTNVADSPTGLDFNLHQPQSEEYEGRANTDLKDARVQLPKGIALNPSSANGLSACSSAQIGLLTPVGQAQPIHISKQPQRCPDAAKIGRVEVSTPTLDHKLSGWVYVAKPFDNPFSSLLAIYLAVEDEESGIIAKFAGKVEPDPQTGQLTTVFRENPELPIEDIDLHLFNGSRAALSTPLACGTYETTSELTPWSTPEGADAQPSDSFQVASAPGGGTCPSSEASAPNAPSFTAGTVEPRAGAFSPFVLKVGRADGTQRLAGIEAALPKGLIGKLAGIPYCSEAAIAQAESRSHPGEGALEQNSPSCPSSSEVGAVSIAAGSGPTPLHVAGRAYLAGPYKGAPLSLVVVTPSVAGPYDLGAVVVRTALRVDPETARITAVSDPLPTILQGVPLDLRSVEVKLDRPNFSLNPTSCDPTQITGTVTTALGQGTGLSSPFQVGGCSGLVFKPKLHLKLVGPTTRAKNPAIKATVRQGAGQANIGRVSVALPHSEFLDQSHIRTICTRVQFAQGQIPGEKCPKGSVYGSASVTTPLLSQPVSGPVYLRASSHELPDLVVALHGQVDVVVDGRIDSVNGGIRATFEALPDAPVSSFTLNMQGGKKGLIENSTNICRGTQKATVKMTGQNGKPNNFQAKIANDCKKAKKKPHGHGH